MIARREKEKDKYTERVREAPTFKVWDWEGREGGRGGEKKE